MRDYKKIKAYQLADDLCVSVYGATQKFPKEELYGITSQIRRASVSVAANIVEGCARRTMREYLQFINVATGSGAEALYLLDVSNRLGFLQPEAYRRLEPKYTTLIKGLKKLQISLGDEWPKA